MEITNETYNYLKSRVVKRTMEECIEYFESMGCTKEEWIVEIENEFQTDFDNIKYWYIIEGENLACFADGIETKDGKFKIQTECSERFGIWMPAREVSYSHMIDCLINNCTIYK